MSRKAVRSIRKTVERTILALGLASCAALTACGQGQNVGNAGSASSTCSSGYVYSSTYGCLSQSSCPSGYGLYNGACVYAGSTSTTSGCVPISQAIPFYGSGVTIDAYGDVSGGTYTVGSSSTVTGTTFSAGGSGYSVGTIQLSIPSTTLSSSTTIGGSLSIGSSYQQWITNNASVYGYGTSNTSGTGTTCVSGILIQGRLYGSSGFSGNVYLYLNGTQHGVILSY